MRTSIGVCLARQMRGGKVTLNCGARGQMLFMELIMRRGSMKKIHKELHVIIRCNETMIMLCKSSDKIELILTSLVFIILYCHVKQLILNGEKHLKILWKQRN